MSDLTKILLGIAILAFIGFIAATPVWLDIAKKRYLMRTANSVTKMRSRHLESRQAAIKEEAKRMQRHILEASQTLINTGKAHTTVSYVAHWFEERHYKVTKVVSYSNEWDIEVPAATEKEVADLIVK